MTTSLFAWRYFKSPKSTNAINVIAWISVVAIMVVTACLIIVLSVFNGFEDLVKSLYNDFYPQLKISPVTGKSITINTAQFSQIKQLENVQSIQPVVEEKAILLNEQLRSIVNLKGVGTNYQNESPMPKHIIRGKFEIGTEDKPALVLGGGVEHSLGVQSDRSIFPVTVYLPNRKAKNMNDPLEALQSKNVNPVGSFLIQEEFDNKYAFTNIVFMQSLLQMDSNEYSSVEIFMPNGTKSNADILLQKKIQNILGSHYKVQNRYQLNQNLYSAMQIEKLIIYAVAILILMIAAFNMVGSLTMLVIEKQKDIAVLQAMGAHEGWVRKIFLKEGILLSILGGGSGIVLALLICIGQKNFHWIKLGGQSFIIDYYPVSMRIFDFAAVAVIIACIGFAAAWLPGRKAVRTFVSLKG